MELTLYHGSEHESLTPILEHISTDKEYGQGFYLTCVEEKAKQWAVVNNPVSHTGYVHKYKLNTDGLKVLYVHEDCTLMELLSIIAKNKEYLRNMMSTSKMAEKVIEMHYEEKVEEYDIIIGHRFDVRYMQFIERILRGTLSIKVARKHLQEMASHEEEFVIALKTQKALDSLEMVSNPEKVEGFEYREAYTNNWNKVLETLRELDSSPDNLASDNIQHMLA